VTKENLPKRPAAWFSLHGRPDDYRVTFHSGWFKLDKAEQDAAMEGVFNWMWELIHADRNALSEV
jgi:hypothetical protein